nr:hypothetical protein GCM10020092_001180 [Actinoplanes digitatis]
MSRFPGIRHDGIMTARVRAPEFQGRNWLNTGGRELKLADVRGKIVLLDFWTFCCINCLHVLDELRPLEQEYGDALVVIGVHSPKFEHERDPQALAAAVERYGVHHPVLDDADMAMWQQYASKAWPTLAVLDPEGYLVASMVERGPRRGTPAPAGRADRHARGEGLPAPRRRAVRPAGRRRNHPALPGQGDRAAERQPARLGLCPPLPRRAGPGRRDPDPPHRHGRARPRGRPGRGGELLRAAGPVPAARRHHAATTWSSRTR